MEGTPGAYYSPVKVRASASKDYFEEQAPAQIYRDTTFLFLDDKIAELLPKMKMGGSLFVELAYPDEQKVTEFKMDGIDVALAKLAAVGCRP